MPRRNRKNPVLHKFILLAALLLFSLSQVSPDAQTALFNAVLKPLLLIGFIIAIIWIFALLINNNKKSDPWQSKKNIPEVTPRPRTRTKNHPTTLTEARPTTPPEPLSTSPSWSLALLQDLEWKRFEQLCEAYFKTKNLDARVSKVGADGGVDITLFKHKSDEVFALMQCKAWKGRVGVKPVREFYGVMASENIARGIFLCSGEYTTEAKLFCEGKGLRLMTGKSLLNAILKLEDTEQAKLLNLATQGDYRTPTCPNCDIKLKERKGKQEPFWGCLNFPRCRYTVRMRKSK